MVLCPYLIAGVWKQMRVLFAGISLWICFDPLNPLGVKNFFSIDFHQQRSSKKLAVLFLISQIWSTQSNLSPDWLPLLLTENFHQRRVGFTCPANLPGSPRPRLPPHILTEVAPLSLFSASTPRCSILGVSLVFLRVAVSVLENVRISVNPDLFAVLNVYFHNSLKFLHRNSIILVIFSEVQSIKTTTTTIQRQLTTLRIFRLL